ncbi:MAG: insulinase family protein, partial [Ignavibacteriaceae bacterium]|nr:insulinase family protein [Ignavibacteriaceae bacterium]
LRNGEKPQVIKSNASVLNETKSITFEDKVNLERIYLAWHTQNAFDEDDAALDILSDVLSGSKNARLTRKLIYELQIAQDINSMQFSGKYGGHFMIVATAKPGKTLDDIKKIIFDEVSLLISDSISQSELQRSKNVIKSNFIYSLQNIDTVADLLNLYNFYLGEPNSFNFDLSRYNNVDELKIQQIAKKYLQKNYVELRIVPEKQNDN